MSKNACESCIIVCVGVANIYLHVMWPVVNSPYHRSGKLISLVEELDFAFN